jgi:adenylate cyclase class IV
MEEIEIKYQVNSSLEELNNLIKQQNLQFVNSEEQKDEYWDTESFKIINLKRGLRIRYLGDKIKSIHFKSLFKKSNNDFFVEEIKLFENQKLDLIKLKEILENRLEITKFKNFEKYEGKTPQEVFKMLGLQIAVNFHKKRTCYKENQNKFLFFIDEIDSLPLHIEIETHDRINLKEISKIVEDKLDVINAKQKGYIGILFDKHSEILPEEKFQEKFKQDKLWNILKNEKGIYESIDS